MPRRRLLRATTGASALVALALAATALPAPTGAAPAPQAAPAAAAAAAAAAPFKVPVRIMTWNLHHGQDDDAVEGYPSIRVMMMRYQPTIVLFQEVDKQPGQKSQAQIIAEKQGMRWAYYPTETHSGGTVHGNAILISSDYTFGKIGKTALPPSGRLEGKYPRGVIGAVVNVGRGVRITVGSTHLDVDGSDANGNYTFQQAKFLTDKVIGNPTCATFLAGDMNREPGSPVLAKLTTHLRDGWTAADTQGQVGFTKNWDSSARDQRIDYVLFAKATPLLADVPNGTDIPSDHKPVVVSFKVDSRNSC